MKKILILSMARIGDLVQATPLIAGLRNSTPACEIHVIVQDRFMEMTTMIDGVDKWYSFEQKKATAALYTAEDRFCAYGYLSDFMAELENEHYDQVINLACSPLSAHICAILATSVSGLSLHPDGTRVISGFWAYYLFGLMLGDARRYNRINMADLFCLMADLQPDGKGARLRLPAKAADSAERLLANCGGQRKIVAIQIGASEQERCWGSDAFEELAHTLNAAGYQPVFVGAPAEKALVDAAAQRCGGISLAGRTSLPELAGVLSRAELLVTNDTGTMHIAAAVGTKVVMIATGPAHHHCTGPLVSGAVAVIPKIDCWPCHYNSHCRSPLCRGMVTPADVAELVIKALAGAAVTNDFASCRVAVSSFDKNGLCQWSDIGDQPWSLGYRNTILATQGLAGYRRSAEGCCPPLAAKAARAAQLAARICSALVKRDAAQANRCWEKLSTTEQEIWALARQHPEAAVLCDLARLMIEDVYADNPAALARVYAGVWATIATLAGQTNKGEKR